MKPVVIGFVGPSGSGKSFAINSLVGKNLLSTGAYNTTDKITIVGETEYKIENSIHVNAKIVSDDGIEFEAIEIPGFTPETSDNLKFEEDVFKLCDIIYWMTDCHLAFKRDFEEKWFSKTVELLEGLKCQGFMIKMEIVLTKYSQRTLDNEIVSDSESNNSEIADEDEIPVFEEIQNNNLPDYPIKKFNAYGRCFHEKSSKTLRKIVKMHDSKPCKSHTTFEVGIDQKTFNKEKQSAIAERVIELMKALIENDNIWDKEKISEIVSTINRLDDEPAIKKVFDLLSTGGEIETFLCLQYLLQTEKSVFKNMKNVENADNMSVCFLNGLDDYFGAKKFFMLTDQCLKFRFSEILSERRAMKDERKSVGEKILLRIAQNDEIINLERQISELDEECAREKRTLYLIENCIKTDDGRNMNDVYHNVWQSLSLEERKLFDHILKFKLCMKQLPEGYPTKDTKYSEIAHYFSFLNKTVDECEAIIVKYEADIVEAKAKVDSIKALKDTLEKEHSLESLKKSSESLMKKLEVHFPSTLKKIAKFVPRSNDILLKKLLRLDSQAVQGHGNFQKCLPIYCSKSFIESVTDHRRKMFGEDNDCDVRMLIMARNKQKIRSLFIEE